jgi:hypothetical protein
MAERDPRPEAVNAATAWLREHGATYTPEALDGGLHDQGYTDAEIAAARLRVAAGTGEARVVPERRDLRATAAIVLIVAFLAAWALVAVPLWMAENADGHGFAGTAAAIFTVLILIVGVVSLFAMIDSRRLREGTTGVLVGFLAVPFTVLVVLAGLCVTTTRDLR